MATITTSGRPRQGASLKDSMSRKQKKSAALRDAKKKSAKPQPHSHKAASKTALRMELPKELALRIHDFMVKARVLEERLIKIYKVGEGYFWIGSPGEEAFGVPLGMLGKIGRGPNFDFFHLHYRGTPTLVTMGLTMKDSIRLMMNRATDPCTGGRNFSGHYCFPQWNVAPVTSPIEVQYTTAIGTAHVQARMKTDAITIVTGGDAGTAEGDFASSLIWASRKGSELPLLLTVQNNRWGISTPYETQHGEVSIADRGKAFGIRTRVINGNDPEESYLALQEEMYYVRRNRKPVLLEAHVSRLYGHSSATGASKAPDFDCVTEFENRLLRVGWLKEPDAKKLWTQYEEEGKTAQEEVRQEAPPNAESIWDNVFVDNENADWRKF